MDDHTICHKAELSVLFMGLYCLSSFFVDPSQGGRSVVQVLGSPVGGGLDVGHVALHVDGPRVDRGNHDQVWHVAIRGARWLVAH
eukprot:11726216-Alexandrium_andersonii.AAC.1